jgi:hypothetical protein
MESTLYVAAVSTPIYSTVANAISGAESHVRRNKRFPNRADRHRERQVLAAAAGCALGPDAAEHAEVRLLVKKSMWMTKRWRKWRDAPLAEVVEYKLRRRAAIGMESSAAVEARIERIRSRLR